MLHRKRNACGARGLEPRRHRHLFKWERRKVNKNIVVVGTGYVGLSIACLLGQHNHVRAIDLVPEKVQLVNAGKSPIRDPEIEAFLAAGSLDLSASTDSAGAYADADCIVVATPTDYDSEKNFFNTRSIESVLDDIAAEGTRGTVVVKSTVPVGYTEKTAGRYPGLPIVFSPEFLREGHALYDNLHPSRIVTGVPFHDDALAKRAREFAALLAEAADEDSADIPTIVMGSTEAEAVKLFSNTYLAMRVAYFNELDTYAEQQGLEAGEIIAGMGLDRRIGDWYNNPSFGYGGYCLPKDSKQLLANFADVPQQIMGAVVEANRTRKDYIAARAIELAEQNHLRDGRDPAARLVVGIYRLTMKKDSDNFRHSSILGVMRRLEKSGVTVLVYEPAYTGSDIYGDEVTHDLAAFKERCDVILANRFDDELADIADSKVYTRDLFKRD